MKVIKQEYKIKAPAKSVWKALTDPSTISKWGGGPSKMNDEEGYRFSLWGGDVFGKNIKIVKNKLLEQEWYGGKWDKPSIVTFTLNEQGGVTTVLLNHKDVPEDEVKDIKQGWKDYYMVPLKQLLEGN